VLLEVRVSTDYTRVANPADSTQITVSGKGRIGGVTNLPGICGRFCHCRWVCCRKPEQLLAAC